MPLSRNLGTLTSWNPLGHYRPVTGLLYLLCGGFAGKVVEPITFPSSITPILQGVRIVVNFFKRSWDNHWFGTFNMKAMLKSKVSLHNNDFLRYEVLLRLRLMCSGTRKDNRLVL